MHLESSLQSDEGWTQAQASFATQEKHQTSIDSDELESKTHKVRLRLFQNISMNNLEPVLLMPEREEKTYDTDFHFPSYLFLTNENQKKIERKVYVIQYIYRDEIKKKGCQALAKIIPHFSITKKPCFDILISKPEVALTRSDILKLTYLNLRQKGLNCISLKSEDILKFGRELYRINIVDDTICPNFNWLREIKVQKENIEGMCRICLSNQQEKDDPIISPCSCTGSCGYVHIQCLRQWLNTRMIIYKGQKVIAYNLQIFECEVCKTELPKYMKVKEDLVELLPMKLQSESFVMLQKITETKKICYVIPYCEGKSLRIKIGRSEENDIIMSDMSISRRHATLNIYPGGDVQLSDNKSKFGTFVALKRNIYNCQRVSLVNNRSILKLDSYYVD